MNTPPDKPLTDGVVTVRMRHDADLPFIAAGRENPEAARWLDSAPSGRTPPTTPEAIIELWRGGEVGPLMIADAATDEAAGLINLQFRAPGDTSIAYHVFPAWRGHGFAARALDLVAEWAFSHLGLHQLVLEIDEGNVASIRVAERAGFVRSVATTDGEPPKAVFVRESPGWSGRLTR